MCTEQILLVEDSVGQVERNCGRFTENFAHEIGQMSSTAQALVPSPVQIDPLKFLQSARDRFKQIEEAGETSIVPEHLEDAEQFNLAANAMLRALAKTLGPDLNPGTREAWITALRVIAGRASAGTGQSRQFA